MFFYLTNKVFNSCHSCFHYSQHQFECDILVDYWLWLMAREQPGHNDQKGLLCKFSQKRSVKHSAKVHHFCCPYNSLCQTFVFTIGIFTKTNFGLVVPKSFGKSRSKLVKRGPKCFSSQPQLGLVTMI